MTEDEIRLACQGLEAQLKVLKDQEVKLANERRRNTHPRYRFTLYRSGEDSWHKVYDETCGLWTIHGEVLNQEEVKAAGLISQSGGMCYLYNGATRKLICSVSGGTSYFGWSGDPDATSLCAALGARIYANPWATRAEPIDVTDLLEAHRVGAKRREP
jgi:hypothetical protein